MTYARKTLISLQDTPYYHVVARCVRRAWLYGTDEYAGRDYSHRRSWVLERLHLQPRIIRTRIDFPLISHRNRTTRTRIDFPLTSTLDTHQLYRQ